MTSYLERWKLQREQSRLQRLNDHRNCYNRDVGDELTFISDTELNKDAETEAQSYQSRDESFNFPSVDDFPASKSEEKHQHIGKDDEFVNGATFLKNNELSGDESFSQDIEVYWEQGNSIGRPSDFFEKKSRSLSHVELSSPRNVDDFTFQENLIGSEISELRLSSVPQSTDDGLDALVTNRCDRNSGLTGSNTAFSSGCELHFDSSRLVYTPNSLKNLQEKSRLKSEKAKYDSNEPDHIIADYVGEAEVVINNGPSLPDQDIPEIPSSEYMATLLRGPEVIKKALHELNALIDKSISFASSSPKQDPRDAHTYKELHELVPRYEHPKESMLPLSRTTDSWGEDTSISQVDDDVGCRSQDFESLYRNHQPGAQLKMGSRKSKSQEMPDLDTIREVPCPSNTDYVLRSPQSTFGRNNYSLPPHLQTQCPFDTSIYINEVQEQQEDSLHTKCAESSHDHKSDENSTKIKRYAHDETERSWIVGSNSVDLNCEYSREEKNDNLPQNILSSKYEDDKCYTNDNMVSRSKAVQQQALASDRNNMSDRKTLHEAMDAATIPRRCRRFLCCVGDIMTEQIVFTNSTQTVGRIRVALLPLSTGCQQFSVLPAALELAPQTSGAFHVTLTARYAGAVSGIFQFRGVGTDSLFPSYEVVIEASVRRNDELEARNSRTVQQRCKPIHELQACSSLDEVTVTPTFIRFECVQNKRGEKFIRKGKLCLANNTAQTLPFNIRAHENLRVSPACGTIEPLSTFNVSLLPISQPFAHYRGSELKTVSSSPSAKHWLGSLMVQIGKAYVREVSVMVDRRLIQMLPPFDEIARSRHRLYSQTDSFYYTNRVKRRGLYFHARAVEFGRCAVGESHQVPVYVCNGSKAPMTVFLQDIQEPFSCTFSTTTIESRKFIEIMVVFTPKVVGKVSTSLFAYSLNDKAVVTLVARGI